MSGDIHTPTSAAPAPDAVTEPVAVPFGDHDPGGLAALVDARPEVLAGGAFAGGLLAALILKRLGSRD